MHLACFNPFSPIAETTSESYGSNRAQREASPGSVGESEGASVTPSVGAEATAVQSALVETRKQVLVRHALQKAPSPTATFRLNSNMVASTVNTDPHACAAG